MEDVAMTWFDRWTFLFAGMLSGAVWTTILSPVGTRGWPSLVVWCGMSAAVAAAIAKRKP